MNIIHDSGLDPIAFGWSSPLPYLALMAVLFVFCWWATGGWRTRLVAGAGASVIVAVALVFMLAFGPGQLRIPAESAPSFPTLIDLTAHYNGSLADNGMDPRDARNQWGGFPTRVQRLAGVGFDARGLIQVGQECRKHSLLVKGIEVRQPCHHLHFLHAARNTALLEDGLEFGRRVAHSSSGGHQEIPLVLGREFIDWQIQPRSREAYMTTWTGGNPGSRAMRKHIRSFKTTWENPFSEAEGLTVDLLSASRGPSPFLVALTAETNVTMSTARRSREARWKEDLDYFAQELPARHKDFFKLITKERFDEAMRELQREIPRLSDAEMILRLKRLAASLGVAHTGVGWPSGNLAFSRYPLLLFWYSDGLGVFAATSEYRDAIGCRVEAIGSLKPEQVEKAVAPCISRENNAWLHNQSPSFICIPEVLQHLNIARADGRVQFLLTKLDGNPLTLEFAPASGGNPAPWILPWNALPMTIPLCHKYPALPYWYEYLPETRTVYIQYRVCENAPNFPFAAFARGLFAFADSHPVGRVIVDLRSNSGGDSAVIKPLLQGLKSRPALHGRGHLYALIGRGTFSSGLLAAFDLKREAGAILVGESTGGKPNGYGEMHSFKLPNSQLVVTCCVKYFHLVDGADPPSLDPDLPAAIALKDFLAGRDPALETALHHLP